MVRPQERFLSPLLTVGIFTKALVDRYSKSLVSWLHSVLKLEFVVLEQSDREVHLFVMIIFVIAQYLSTLIN